MIDLKLPTTLEKKLHKMEKKTAEKNAKIQAH